MKKEQPRNEILIYQTEDGQTKIEVAFDGDTVWLPLNKIAEVFQRDKSTISRHIKNIHEDEELNKSATVAFFATVQNEGKREVEREIEFFNLDMILAVGYRVKSPQGIHFRKWATGILKEYMKKGFAMNDDLLKNAGSGTYFRELLERIRDIRSSEKVFYRQVLDLFATSIDYDPKSEIANEFFKEMQNKLLFAVSEKTAPELIAGRVNAELPFMGLQAFKGIKPQKHEVLVSKNYLTENEIKELNLTVSAYLDIAELKARKRQVMHMTDWVKELERFIVYQEMPVLEGKGKITREEADEKVELEYNKYRIKNKDELTPVEQDFLETINRTYKLLEGKPRKDDKK